MSVPIAINNYITTYLSSRGGYFETNIVVLFYLLPNDCLGAILGEMGWETFHVRVAGQLQGRCIRMIENRWSGIIGVPE